ncbi:MAG: VOC family protein [Verrucomicrobiota bacterium]|nr:VOC family protein [Verrucomicrobiota bacterium]
MLPATFACDDIDQTYEELKKRGVEFDGPPEKQPWGTYAMFTDSEGNRFVLSQDKGLIFKESAAVRRRRRRFDRCDLRIPQLRGGCSRRLRRRFQ